MYRKLNETFYVDFLVHDPTTGKIANATTISGFVFEDNNDTSTYTPSISLRSGTTGNYRAELVLTGANGFSINKSYNTIVQVLVAGVTAKANIASFYILGNTVDTISGQISVIPTPPTVGDIDSQLSGAHGAGTWDAVADTTAITNYLISISGITTAMQAETDKISTILGLSQSNFRIKDATYTAGKLTSSTIRLYNSNTDCLADTNHFKEFAVAASYSGDELTSYTVTEV